MYVPALIGGLGPWELGIILVLVLILFGAGKLPQVFESFGIAVKKFRDAQKDESIDVTPRELDDHVELGTDPVREHDKAHNS